LGFANLRLRDGLPMRWAFRSVCAVHDIAELEAPFAPLKPEIVPVAAPASDGELVLPVPADAPPMPEIHFALGRPSGQWHYRDAAGAPLFWVLRFDKSDGGKEFLPLTLWRDAQGLRWRWKSIPPPRLLYNLDKLAALPDAPVVVCEGEKSADAGARIFPKSVAVTSPSGAKACEKADWTVLRDRKVLIWPDADKPGRDYAAKVAAILAAMECDVSVIDADALARIAPTGGTREPSKEGWDAADAMTEWSDLAALRLAALDCKKPFHALAYISFEDFEMSDAGLYREVTRGRGDNAETVTVRISAPFEIVGRGRDPDGRAWGRFLRWRDPDGRMHEKFVSDETLHHEPAALCAPLAADGLEIVREQQRAFASYLSGAQPAGRVTVVHRTGWHEIEGENVFVLPGENIGRKGVGRVLLDGAAHGPYETKGTLADWREGIAALASGHVIPMLAISTAFAGPVLYLASLEGGGLNLFGQSSRGKTTCLQAAASVWGRGTTPGYVRAWRATSNGLEGAAAQFTDTVMVLDELSMVDARDAQQALYGIANGQGKQRAGRDGSPREPKSWRVLYLSSGELPVEAKLSEAPGRKARAGQLVRLLDVPADRGAGFGVFDNGGSDGDAGELAKRIKLAASSAYGTAGPAFVRRLIADSVTGDDVRGLILQFVTATIPVAADGQVERAAGSSRLRASLWPNSESYLGRLGRPAMRQLGRWNDGLSFAAAQSRPRRGRRLRRFGCLLNNTVTPVLRRLTMPTCGRWQTAPATGRAAAQSESGGFCRKSGRLRFVPAMMPNSSHACWPMRECFGDKPKACNAKSASAARRIGATSSRLPFLKGRPMRAETLAELSAVMRGIPGGTAGTPGTSKFAPAQKSPSFHVFRVFQVEHDENQKTQFGLGTPAGTLPDAFDVAERAAIAIEDGRVPPAYADAWAAFQIRKPGQVCDAHWFRAVDDAGRFLDEWAGLALDFEWRPSDILGPRGLAWFCAGEPVRALGPDNAITASGRIFARQTVSGCGNF
jgi:putative DNA primase/helicase